MCSEIKSLYDQTVSSHLCKFHHEEFQILFPDCSSKLFRWEYDSNNGAIDYLSNKRNGKKAPERFLSLKPTDDDSTFVFSDTLFNGTDISSLWLHDTLINKLGMTSLLRSSSGDFTVTDGWSTPPDSSPSTDCSGSPDSSSALERSPSVSSKLEVTAANSIAEFRDYFFESPDTVFFSEQLAKELSDFKISSLPPLTSPAVSSKLRRSIPESEAGPIPILVSIEGNIGAGKSTLLRALREQQLDWCFIDEPLDTWTSLKNDEGVSLLELFYGDQRRWSYTFQNCALLSRFQNI